MTWTMTGPARYEDELERVIREEAVVMTPEVQARLAELSLEEREVYLEQLGLRVENADAEINPRGEIAAHEYFGESARGAGSFMGSQGPFPKQFGHGWSWRREGCDGGCCRARWGWPLEFLGAAGVCG
jgi:hypothetical protein